MLNLFHSDAQRDAYTRRGNAMMGHISVQIVRTGDDSFELTVLRSFAESLWDELRHMAASAEKEGA